MSWLSDKIDIWSGEKRRREERWENAARRLKHEQIEKEIMDILTDVAEDWSKNRYDDKVEANNGTFKYKKEDGNSFEMTGKTLIFFDKIS